MIIGFKHRWKFNQRWVTISLKKKKKKKKLVLVLFTIGCPLVLSIGGSLTPYYKKGNVSGSG